MSDLTDEELDSIERSLGGPEAVATSKSETARMLAELRRRRQINIWDSTGMSHDSYGYAELRDLVLGTCSLGQSAATYGVLLAATRGAVNMTSVRADGKVHPDDVMVILGKALSAATAPSSDDIDALQDVRRLIVCTARQCHDTTPFVPQLAALDRILTP